MSAVPTVESLLKYRDGKKWKERWCVLKKPSPIADCSSISLYKDESKAMLKSTMTLEEFCGVDDNYITDNEQITLCVICKNKTIVLAFSKEQTREQWKQCLLESYGADSCFPVDVLGNLTDLKSSTNSLNDLQQSANNDRTSCHLFLGSTRLSLSSRITSDVTNEPRHLYSCRYECLKSFDYLGGKRFYFAAARNGRVIMRFVMETPLSAHINELMRNKVQHVQQSLGLLYQVFPNSIENHMTNSMKSVSTPSTPTYPSLSLQSNATSIFYRKISDKLSNNNNNSNNIIHLPPKGQTTPTLTTIPLATNNHNNHNNAKKLTKIRNSSFEGSSLSHHQQQHDQSALASRHHSDCDLRCQEQCHDGKMGDNIPQSPQQQQQSQQQQPPLLQNVYTFNRDPRRSSVDSFQLVTTTSSTPNSPSEYINVNNMKTSSSTSKSTLPPAPRHHAIGKYKKSYSLSSSFGRLLKPFKDEQRLFGNNNGNNNRTNDKKFKNIDKTIKQLMMNGGTCENVSTSKYDPLQPLPYKDLSRYDDDDSDGIYMCWTASNLSSLESKMPNPSIIRKVDYINPDVSNSNNNNNNNNKQSKSFPMKLKTNVGDYLKPNYSSDSINQLPTLFYKQPQQFAKSPLTYVNILDTANKTNSTGSNLTKNTHSNSDAIGVVNTANAQNNDGSDSFNALSNSPISSADGNYITMQQLGINIYSRPPNQPSDSISSASSSSLSKDNLNEKVAKGGSIGPEDNNINVMSTVSDVVTINTTECATDGMDYFEKNYEDKFMSFELTNQNDSNRSNDQISSSDDGNDGDGEKNINPKKVTKPATTPHHPHPNNLTKSLISNEEILREQLMKSPPPNSCQAFSVLPQAPTSLSSSSTLESQDYINLSSMTSVVLSPPPPLPPKTLPIIKEDAQETSSSSTSSSASSNPPPIPAKTKHVRNNSFDRNLNQNNGSIPKPEIFLSNQNEPKPPIPKRQAVFSNSPNSQSTSNTLPFHCGSKSSSVSSLSNLPLSSVRPVSASNVSKHRKPNLTVQIDGTLEEESIPMSRKSSRFSDITSITSSNSYRMRKNSEMNDFIMNSKRSSFDSSRSSMSLATSKPRNGREYLDRRRLVDDPLPAFTPQQSPSMASTVFSFDDKNGMYNCSSGEESPKFPNGLMSIGRSSSRVGYELMRRIPPTPQDSCFSHDSPGPDSPGNQSTRTRTSMKTIINYADIDVLSMESSIEQLQSANKGFKIPPSTPSPHDKTVYATIDLMATVAASQVGKQHAKQRENTLERPGDSSIGWNRVNGSGNSNNNSERRRFSLEQKRYPSSILKE